MKFILTSTGLSKGLIRDKFLDVLNCNPANIKVAFIPTAADPEDDKWFVKAAIDEIKEIEMQLLIVDLKKENQESLKEKLSNCQVIYVNGGSSSYLLKWAIKSGFDKILREIIDNKKVYVGSSAGSVFAGPTGIGLVPFTIYPHFIEKNRKVLEDKIKNSNHQIISLTDKQAVFIDSKSNSSFLRI